MIVLSCYCIQAGADIVISYIAYRQGLMFWSESSGLAIWRTSLDGSSEPVRIADYESAVSTSGSCNDPSDAELTCKEFRII